VKAPGLVDTLEGSGLFTVFAPVNAAFAALPAGTAADLDKLIRKGHGSAMLKSASGGTLTFAKNGEHNITVAGESGHIADIAVYDVLQSNRVIFSIDQVLMPK
jgi:uncharacterized surface protein with fasciclin (FAS1) repeats